MKTFEKTGGNLSKFQKKMGSKGNFSKKFDSGRKSSADKKTDRKCFNCGSTDHLAKDCPQRKNDGADDYWKLKYKKLVDALKAEKLDHKVMMAEEEK